MEAVEHVADKVAEQRITHKFETSLFGLSGSWVRACCKRFGR